MKRHIPNTLVFILLTTLSFFSTCAELVAQNDTINIKDTHYVFPDFIFGTVKMKNGSSEEAMMNYNKLTKEMIFEKNGTMLALDSLEMIDTVYIDSRKFVPYNKSFLEVLIEAPAPLFIDYGCNLLSTGNPSGYGGTTETGASRNLLSLTNSGRAYKLDLPVEYNVTDASLYWIRRNGNYYLANTKRQLMKIFPEKSKEIKLYIEQKKLNLKDAVDLVKTVVYCNYIIRQ